MADDFDALIDAHVPIDSTCYCGQCDGHHGHPDGPSFPVVTLADLEAADA